MIEQIIYLYINSVAKDPHIRCLCDAHLLSFHWWFSLGVFQCIIPWHHPQIYTFICHVKALYYIEEVLRTTWTFLSVWKITVLSSIGLKGSSLKPFLLMEFYQLVLEQWSLFVLLHFFPPPIVQIVYNADCSYTSHLIFCRMFLTKGSKI